MPEARLQKCRQAYCKHSQLSNVHAITRKNILTIGKQCMKCNLFFNLNDMFEHPSQNSQEGPEESNEGPLLPNQ